MYVCTDDNYCEDTMDDLEISTQYHVDVISHCQINNLFYIQVSLDRNIDFFVI